ncbi:unnamed protein product [Rodentolepis nana]|uniref:Uncharacterized protein n=1 Tax=Rodentolepis nana TaxID=102285 RepID=A0A0R3U0Y3_RODNA|nr:unnamed protein product [Rodentolepis nana]
MPPPTSTVRRTTRLRSSTASTRGTANLSTAPPLSNIRRTPRRASTQSSNSRS